MYATVIAFSLSTDDANPDHKKQWRLCLTLTLIYSLQWRTEGGAEGAIRPGRHSEGSGKKGKKEKRKKGKKEKKVKKDKKEKKREKENMGEACNFSIKWSILAAAPLCTYNLTFWRPYPFWRGRVVRLIIRVLFA